MNAGKAHGSPGNVWMRCPLEGVMAGRVLVVPRLYVSAAGDLDLRPLLDGLKRRGTDPYVLSDVAPLGADIVQSLRLAIESADRVLVVLSEEPSLNPVVEAGIALALGKPLLIIAAPGASVPSDLAGQLIAQARHDDLDAINFALDHAEARTPSPIRTSRPALATGRPLGPAEADRLLSRLSEPGLTERSAIAILLEAIEASGEVGVHGTGERAGFDLGVWSDDLDAIGGNPLIIELKRSLRPGAVDQVLCYLEAHPSARLGLLVYLDPATGEGPFVQDELSKARFPVLVISLYQLLQRMTSASFAEVIRDMRNRTAHGPGPS
jgi:hypothetical protein